MKKVFITGSEGFVGQHLINLLQKDHSIVGLSRNTALEPRPNVVYEIGDIQDHNRIYQLLEEYQPDVIMHLAGIAKTWGNDPKEVFDINLYGTLNIYQTVVKLKKERGFNPKIIFVSSAEVYGNTQTLDSISEDAGTFPINFYGSSKLAADRLSYQYSQTDHLNIAILRPFPHIGPGQQKGFIVPDIASQIVALEKDPNSNELLIGNIDSVRDFSDVRDVVKAYKLIIEKDLSPGEVFNVCSGTGTGIKDLLDRMLKLAKKPITIKQDPARLRAVDLPVFVGNNKKLVDTTGWTPEYSLDKTLQDVIDYWRKV